MKEGTVEVFVHETLPAIRVVLTCGREKHEMLLPAEVAMPLAASLIAASKILHDRKLAERN